MSTLQTVVNTEARRQLPTTLDEVTPTLSLPRVPSNKQSHSRSQSHRERTHEGYAWVLSAARRKVSSSRLGAVTKAMPLRMVLSHSIPTPPCRPACENWAQSHQSPTPPRGAWPDDHSTQSHQPVSKQQLLYHRFIRHPGHVS
eukprot:365736-Chlamydomonas_euryale.AAC.7